jgi:hypothetical protein
MLGLVVFGSRTWMCTMAAPAFAASIAELAICLGVTGTAELRPGVSAEPVTAHEIIIFRCMASPNATAKDIERAADHSLVQLEYLNCFSSNIPQATNAAFAIPAGKGMFAVTQRHPTVSGGNEW